ncbi:MAG: fumarate hydratase [Bacilli bacterium]|jgi:fumarate hydratase subunit alpha|nr:fumarate hydratase [Bacilli bacterium]
MRTINYQDVVEQVKGACIRMTCDLPHDVQAMIEKKASEEDGKLAKEMLNIIIENANIARNEQRPMCQDTGMVVCFASIGQDVHIEGGLLTDAINEGVAQGYTEGYLRKSVVNNPLDRVNTLNNTPAIIHYDIVEGDKLTLVLAAKGFGSENMSQLKMFPPAAGIEGAKEFILKVVKEAGPNPCPPLVIGVGLGGDFEMVAKLAKQAAIRNLDYVNPNEKLLALEKELEEEINKMGIGPQGFGGKTFVLKVNIEMFATHIAGLPVAVNINCHAARHIKVVL